MLMKAGLLTVVVIPFLQYEAANPTVRIKNHALDTYTVVVVVKFAFYIRPTAPLQVASGFLQEDIRLKQCTTWLLVLALMNMCAMEDFQVNSSLGFENQFKFRKK